MAVTRAGAITRDLSAPLVVKKLNISAAAAVRSTASSGSAIIAE
jgi:hypothetical protein